MKSVATKTLLSQRDKLQASSAIPAKQATLNLPSWPCAYLPRLQREITDFSVFESLMHMIFPTTLPWCTWESLQKFLQAHGAKSKQPGLLTKQGRWSLKDLDDRNQPNFRFATVAPQTTSADHYAGEHLKAVTKRPSSQRARIRANASQNKNRAKQPWSEWSSHPLYCRRRKRVLWFSYKSAAKKVCWRKPTPFCASVTGSEIGTYVTLCRLLQHL